MIKFRIVEVIENSGSADRKGHWIVEQKNYLGGQKLVVMKGLDIDV